MKTIKVSEATETVLDYLVAIARGASVVKKHHGDFQGFYVVLSNNLFSRVGTGYSPSSHWNQGGLIIEREHISVEAYSVPNDERIKCFWYASEDKFDAETWDGPTPLIAAMRCFVASKLGDEVEVPDELE